jgi:hypothetical protein
MYTHDVEGDDSKPHILKSLKNTISAIKKKSFLPQTMPMVVCE